MAGLSPSAAPNDPIRVAVLSADRVFADSLAVMLAGDGMTALRVIPATVVGGLDVVVVESPGLGDPLWQAVEALHREDPLVEVVVVTSEPDVHDAVETVRSGAFTVLQYPVTGEELTEAVLAAGRRKRRATRRIDQIDHERYADIGDPAGDGPRLGGDE